MFLADRYEIVERIGNGGMSDVYKAKDHKLNRNVAVKVLKSEFSGDKDFVSKFRVEAQSAAGLAHPNIVNIYDVGEERDIHFIVMELVEGITLKKYIEKKGYIPYKEAVSIAIQVAKGIEAAHSHHIIHRDIKPQNIIISREGKVKVTDFGIAKAASSTTIGSSAMGSVHYISPEQARGGYTDERSDIYSFGVTFFEMLTGTVPFDGDTTVAVAVQHIQHNIPAPSTRRDGIPKCVDDIVLKCAQKSVDARYQSASELITDLKKALVMPEQDFVAAPPVHESVTPAPAPTPDVPLPYKQETVQGVGEEADIDDESNDKLDAVMKWIGIGIAAVILIVVLFAVVKLAADGHIFNKGEVTTTTAATGSEAVEVPDVTNHYYDEAYQILSGMGLTVTKIERSSDTVEDNYVISQSYPVGTRLKKGTTITLVVSKKSATTQAATQAAQMLTVPNFVGMTEAQAQEAVKNSGGLSGDFNFDYSDTVPAGTVISQSAAAGSSVEAGTTVKIVISRGKATTAAPASSTAAPAQSTAAPVQPTSDSGNKPAADGGASDGSGKAAQ